MLPLRHEKTKTPRDVNQLAAFIAERATSDSKPDQPEEPQKNPAAVESLHGCVATFIESVVVEETFQGQNVWEGIVHVFEIKGHPTATRCYAWSSPVEGSTKRKYFAVLHVPPVASAKDAVRAAIVSGYKANH